VLVGRADWAACGRGGGQGQQPGCRQCWDSHTTVLASASLIHQPAPTSCLLQEGLEARLKEQETAAAQLVANIAGLQAAAKTAEVGAGGLAGWQADLGSQAEQMRAAPTNC
jgi:hypothetical protein